MASEPGPCALLMTAATQPVPKGLLSRDIGLLLCFPCHYLQMEMLGLDEFLKDIKEAHLEQKIGFLVPDCCSSPLT